MWGATRYETSRHTESKCFNSRTPCGVRLRPRLRGAGVGDVSIHAPRVGCDLRAHILPRLGKGFNSRTPCGVRPPSSSRPSSTRSFQFTHPVWGATKLNDRHHDDTTVSIHAPRVGCDKLAPCPRLAQPCFNSRTPCGVRRLTELDPDIKVTVSIHAPRVGCDPAPLCKC